MQRFDYSSKLSMAMAIEPWRVSEFWNNSRLDDVARLMSQRVYHSHHDSFSYRRAMGTIPSLSNEVRKGPWGTGRETNFAFTSPSTDD